MNWYDLIDGNENCRPDHFLADEGDLRGRDFFDLSRGEIIEDWNRQTLLYSSCPKNDGEPDDFLAHAYGFPVISKRLKEALIKSKVGLYDVQYLPIRVRRSTNEELSGFSAMNVIARIPALDRKRSKMLDVREHEIDPLTGLPKVTGIWTAALKILQIKGHDVIRLTEFFPPVFVSQRFVDVCERIRFTGAIFKPVLTG